MFKYINFICIYVYTFHQESIKQNNKCNNNDGYNLFNVLESIISSAKLTNIIIIYKY